MRLRQRENPRDAIAAWTVAVLHSKRNGLAKVIERHGHLRGRDAGMVGQAWLADRPVHLEQHDEDPVEIRRGNCRWHARGERAPSSSQGLNDTLRQSMTLGGEDRRFCPQPVARFHQLPTALDALLEGGGDASTGEDMKSELVG